MLDVWAYSANVRLSFMRPGHPNENAYIESFKGKFRDECLNEHWFVTMAQARRVIENWRVEYNRAAPQLARVAQRMFGRATDVSHFLRR